MIGIYLAPGYLSSHVDLAFPSLQYDFKIQSDRENVRRNVFVLRPWKALEELRIDHKD